MSTYRLLVAYDGLPFHGFQRQPGLETVQGRIESALAKVTGQQILTSAAGRTDAGVHALGQVMSFKSSSPIDVDSCAGRLNSMCGPEVAILEMEEVAEGFDARFSATSRTYEYGILNRPVHDPFARHATWHYAQELDEQLMGKAAQVLLGEHSFESFARVEEGKNPMRRVESIEIEREGDLLAIRITANSFLQQMVRSIVGTLVQVGAGKIDPDDMDRILHARDRAAAGPVAPPHGLFLVSVSYPGELL